MARNNASLWARPVGLIPATTIAYNGARPPLAMASPLANWLVVICLLTDLLTPFLIWKGLLPSALRWTSDLATLALVIILFVRMIVFDRFPAAFWVIAALSCLGITQATLQEQDLLTTIWGWWKTYQFPLLALYAYLNPHWPSRFADRLRWLGVGIIGFQLLVQIGQFVTGEPVGDNLAGTFGRSGVSHLLLFSEVVVSFTLGYGVIKGDWRLFLGTFALGIVSNILAENKIFPVATLLLAALAVCVYLYLGGKVAKLVPYGLLLIGGLALFFVGYNLLVPSADRRPIQQYLLDSEARESYNQRVRVSSDDAATDYNIGRTFAMEYGWQFITNYPDRTVFLVGLGLGARTESTTLGAGGLAFERDGLGLTRGTGMLVLMQESGLLGIITYSSFVLWLSYQMLADVKRYPNSPVNEFRIGILLYTLLFPLWLWYKPLLWSRVAMLLYWIIIGYLFHHRQQDQADHVVVPASYTRQAAQLPFGRSS